MSVTEQDRKRARDILNTAPLLDLGGAIAQALADERDQARAPFLAAVEEIELDAAGEASLTDGAAFAAALTHAALRIRRAAEETLTDETLTDAGHDVRRVPVGTTCAVHRHQDYVPLNVHHIRPLGLGGTNTAGNKITVCMNGHGLIHEVIRRLMDNNGMVPDRQHFGAKVVAYAMRGWQEAGRPTRGGGGE